MTVQIAVGDQQVSFRLDWQHKRWHSMEVLDEGLFPLITHVDGKRYELYSDGTFDEVEL